MKGCAIYIAFIAVMFWVEIKYMNQISKVFEWLFSHTANQFLVAGLSLAAILWVWGWLRGRKAEQEDKP